MKSTFFYLLLLIMPCIISCNEDEPAKTSDFFVKTFHYDTAFAAGGSLQLEDGNYLVVCTDQKNYGNSRIPGHMLKLDAKGEILWDKRLSSKTKTLFKVIAIPGTGYATFGWENPDVTWMFICIYDNDGKLLSENRVNTNGANNWQAPHDIIRLSNGNFVIGGGDESTYYVGYQKILDSSCKLLYSKVIFPPDGYKHATVHGMCETADGNIALMSRTAHKTNPLQNNLLLIRTTANGNILSYTFKEDLDYYETTNAIAPLGKDIVAVTSSITYGSPGGTYVNYTSNHNETAPLISGKINLVRFNENGLYSERKIISGYPGNGMINSMRPTRDGGLILCGTVGQSNSAIIVSFTNIFLVKVNARLETEWSRLIETEYPAFGIDAFESSDGGYVVTGHIKSFNKQYQMIVIKTGASGNYY